MNYKFSENQSVTYNNGVMQGQGIVCGYATTELPVMGSMVIIKDMSGNLPNPTYPFKFFTVAECHMKPV